MKEFGNMVLIPVKPHWEDVNHIPKPELDQLDKIIQFNYEFTKRKFAREGIYLGEMETRSAIFFVPIGPPEAFDETGHLLPDFPPDEIHYGYERGWYAVSED